MKHLLFALFLLLPFGATVAAAPAAPAEPVAQTDTIRPYFGKGGANAPQKYFKKTFKRPDGVNYDTSAKIHITCVVEADGTLSHILMDADVQTYTTVVEREHTSDVHGNRGTSYSVMGLSSTYNAQAAEPEILKKAVMEWLRDMPAWTPGMLNGQPVPTTTSFDLRF